MKGDSNHKLYRIIPQMLLLLNQIWPEVFLEGDGLHFTGSKDSKYHIMDEHTFTVKSHIPSGIPKHLDCPIIHLWAFTCRLVLWLTMSGFLFLLLWLKTPRNKQLTGERVYLVYNSRLQSFREVKAVTWSSSLHTQSRATENKNMSIQLLSPLLYSSRSPA